MRFIYPEFLTALLLICLPILIHFLHFKRYRTVYFSQVNFLKAVKEDTRKKSNLKQLLILLARILTISALVFVFAQPYLPTNKQERKVARKIVALYVDNSFSMKGATDNGMLLEQAKSRAISIASSYGPGTNYILMENQNLPGRQQLINQTQLVTQLGKIQEGPLSISVSKAYQQLKNSLLKQTENADNIIYLISDFQSYTSDFSEIKSDTSIQTFLIPLGSQVANNLLIDSCWFETPGHKKKREETLFARVKNLSSQSYQDIPVRLKVNDTIKSISNISIDAETEQIVELVYKNNSSGVHRLVVELDDYPVVYDNQYFLSYNVRDKNDVLAIFQSEDPAIRKLEALFEDDENIRFEKTAVSKVKVSEFDQYQCIYLLNLNKFSSGLVNALSQFVEKGGSLGIFPGMQADLASYNKLYGKLEAGLITGSDSVKLKMNQVNFNHLLLQDVFLHEKENLDLPEVELSYRYRVGPQSSQLSIVDFNNGQTAVSQYHKGQGRVYNFSFPLNDELTDFSKHAIFVPLVYNIALNSFEPQQIQYEIADDLVLTLPQSETFMSGDGLSISPMQADEEIQLSSINQTASEFRVDLQGVVQKAGFYNLSQGEGEVRTLAFNFNRRESTSPQLTNTQLENAVDAAGLLSFDVIDATNSNFEARILEANEGIQLWQLFLAIGLLFIAAEVLITRFWK